MCLLTALFRRPITTSYPNEVSPASQPQMYRTQLEYEFNFDMLLVFI